MPFCGRGGAIVLGRGECEACRFSFMPKLPRHLPQKRKQMFVDVFLEKIARAPQTGNQDIFRGAGYVGRLREADRGVSDDIGGLAVKKTSFYG